MDKESKNEECTMVSIIMPVYNAAEFLKDSVGDILAQTYEDFELICVDDGSTDGSGMMLDEYAAADTRICAIHQDNKGGGAARNRGMSEAKGKYLLFLDADDRFEHSLLECTVNEAKRTSCDVLVFNADTFDYNTGISASAPWLIKDISINPENPFSSLNNTVWNKLFLRSFIEKLSISFTERRAGYSTSFVAASLISAGQITVLDRVLLHYRSNNPNSNFSNEDKDPTAIFDAMKELKESLINNNLFEKKKDIYEYICTREILLRMRLLKTARGFSELYSVLHNGGIDSLELTGENTGGLLDPEVMHTFTDIRNMDIETYLYDGIRTIRNAGLLSVESRILSLEKYPDARRIAIYGGGDVGKDFFMQVMRRSGLTLSCWVDRNWEKIGYPLQSPEMLKEKDYDIVLIAVADKRVADSIRGSLIDMGIPGDKIVWNEYTQII